MTELDENGNPIVEDENNDWDDQQSEDNEADTLRAELDAERAKREKAEINFKKMAKQFNEIKKSSNWNEDVASMVSKQVAEEMYYANNPTAKEFQKEIKEIQVKTWMTPDDAMTFYLAKNKPELLSKQSETWVDGVSKTIDPVKGIKDMTYEDLRGKEKNRG